MTGKVLGLFDELDEFGIVDIVVAVEEDIDVVGLGLICVVLGLCLGLSFEETLLDLELKGPEAKKQEQGQEEEKQEEKENYLVMKRFQLLCLLLHQPFLPRPGNSQSDKVWCLVLGLVLLAGRPAKREKKEKKKMKIFSIRPHLLRPQSLRGSFPPNQKPCNDASHVFLSCLSLRRVKDVCVSCHTNLRTKRMKKKKDQR